MAAEEHPQPPAQRRVCAHPDSSHLMTAVLATAPSIRSQHQCSLDVEALYTSVPVVHALAEVLTKLRDETTPEPLQAEDVIGLLRIVFDLTFFHFEGQIVQQVAGLPMGCAVSGIVAILPGVGGDASAGAVRPLPALPPLRPPSGAYKDLPC